MLTIPGPLDRPDILLTIFHLVEEHGDVPMTQEEIMSLMKACGTTTVSRDELFASWCKKGHLRNRRGRFYVLRQVAHVLQSQGESPALERHQRTGWIVDNATVGLW